MHKIRVFIRALILVTTLLAAMSSIDKVLKVSRGKQNIHFILESLIQGIALVVAVLFVRHQINKVENTYTRLRLVIVHIINFMVWVTLFILANVYMKRAENLKLSDPKGYTKNLQWL